MATDIGCAYGSHSSFTQKFDAFGRASVEHGIFASGVIFAVLFFKDRDHIVPGLMNAGVTALAVNGTHMISHQFWGEQADESPLIKLARVVAVFFFAVYQFPQVAENFDYQISYGQAALFTCLSLSGIVLDSYMRNEEARLAQSQQHFGGGVNGWI